MSESAALAPNPETTALATLASSAQRYAGLSRAPNTKRAYAADWRDFQRFCARMGLSSLPALPETIGLYLTDQANRGRKPATLARRLAAISKEHSLHKYSSPTWMHHAAVKDVMDGIRREKGISQVQKKPAVVEVLKQMLAFVPETIGGLRDRALLLTGFAGALRRSELVALKVEDVEYTKEGMLLNIRNSKTDQERAGEKVGVAFGVDPETCPVRNLKAWLVESEITSGALFRSVNQKQQVGTTALTDQTVVRLVKRYVRKAGLDAKEFAGHSLRAGLATSAAQAGARERLIMKQTRHKSEAMVRRYIRDADVFRDNVSALVGL